MQVNRTENISFKNLYVAKDLNGMQNCIAYNVSKKLSRNGKQGITYLQEIKNLGYDILVVKTELNDPQAVRLCIIKDMKSNKLPDGTYDYLDAKPVCETGMHFSPESFMEKVKYKTEPMFSGIKTFLSDLFSK